MNTQYALLRSDGTIQSPPKRYISNTEVIFSFNDNPTMMIQHGYYPLVYGTMPDVPDGKIAVPHYAQVDPIATVTNVPKVDEEGKPVLDGNGEQIIEEQTTYDRPNPIIAVTYTLEDAPVMDEEVI